MGGGPAGSSAARASAKAGAKTIFIDKKKEVGAPVQCAEGIGKYLLPYLPFKVPKDQLIWEIDGISFWADDITIERTGRIWSGYAINREKFDKWLVNNAINAGAEFCLETELTDLKIKDSYNVTKAIVKTKNSEKEIKPKVVIAADGVDSTVLKLLRFDIDIEKKSGYVYGVEMNNLKLDKSKFDQIFLGDFAPGGYGYIFPLSKSTANIGVAALFGKEDVKGYFESFLEITGIKNQVENGVIIKEKSGIVPFLNQTKKWAYGNVLLVGDAANQNFKPFVEGFLPAIICGDIAGKSAVEHLTKGAALDVYSKKIRNKFGILYEYSDMIAGALYELGASSEKKEDIIRLGIASNVFSAKKLHSFKQKDYQCLRNNLEKWDGSQVRKFYIELSENLSLLHYKLASILR